MKSGFHMVSLGELLKRSEEWIDIKQDEYYQLVTVKYWGNGVVERDVVSGMDIAADRRLIVKSQQFILSRIDARNGAFGLVPDSLDGAVVSSDFPVFTLNLSRILPEYLKWMSKTQDFIELCKAASEGTTNRIRLKEDRLLASQIPLPHLSEQRRIVSRIEELAARIEEAKEARQSSIKADQIILSKLDEMLSPAKHPSALMGNVASLVKRPKSFENEEKIRSLGVKWWGKGPYVAEEKSGLEFQAERYEVQANDLIYNDMWARHGSVGIVPATLHGCVASAHFPTWDLDHNKVYPQFFAWCFRSPWFWVACEEKSQGSTGRNAISKSEFRKLVIPLPDISEQHTIVEYLNKLQSKVNILKQLQDETSSGLDSLLPSILDKAFKGEL